MARSLRVEQQLTVDELAVRLSLPRSTIYYWVRDLPLRRDARSGGSPKTSHKASRARSEAAYGEGLETFEGLSAQPTFRDFICIYLVQGDRRDRTRVALTNSDPAVIRLVSCWIGRLTTKVPFVSLQYGRGQSLKDLRRFWSETTGAEPRAIRVRRFAAGESGEQPAPDSAHGLLTVGVEDRLLRARLQGWMHRARESWQ